LQSGIPERRVGETSAIVTERHFADTLWTQVPGSNPSPPARIRGAT
jgi:hypothetical protein